MDKTILAQFVASIRVQLEDSGQNGEGDKDESTKVLKKKTEGWKSIIDTFVKSFKKAFNMDAIIDALKKLATVIETMVGELLAGLLESVGGAITIILGLIVGATAIFMDKMAKADLQTQKFALSLYTTVRNARSLQTVMEAMGLKNIDELKYVNLIPEQRAQFLELRKLASGLTLGKNSEEGFQAIRKVNYEFQKLFVVWQYFLTYLAGQLGYVLKGPLSKIAAFIDRFANYGAKHMKTLVNDITVIAAILYDVLELLGKAAAAASGFYWFLKEFEKVFWFLQRVFELIFPKNYKPGSNRVAYAIKEMATVYIKEQEKKRQQSGTGVDPYKFPRDKAGVDYKTLDKLIAFANSMNLRLTQTQSAYGSTIGGIHSSSNSLHYRGHAIDVSPIRGSLEKIRAAAAGLGIKVLEEDKGTANWHLHLSIPSALTSYVPRLPSIHNAIHSPRVHSQQIATADIKIYVNGAHDPVRTAQAVHDKIKSSLLGHGLRGSYA